MADSPTTPDATTATDATTAAGSTPDATTPAEATTPADATTPDATTTPQFDPVLVAAGRGSTVAVWQVETDPRVLLGDFSGAWLVTADGVTGFAAGAEWIPERGDHDAVLRLLLARPVLVVGEPDLPADLGVPLVDAEATVGNLHRDLERTRETIRAGGSGTRQPAWETLELTPLSGRAPDGLDEDATAAVVEAMAWARGIRGLVRAWNQNEKLRVRRLGGDARPLPLVARDGATVH
ncbi:N-acetylglucosamine-6-phosphate deacetylase [Corynebacterium bovis]|uniref:N-acetylglucosamine-6-phosphate deacetylase n=1 Tax=Corynebacterium bovis TaxID=36808 RepID=UPI00244A7F5C|nr:N-acetylglucosamine-6-phosphate deacetylase [Corynebacterium bovis]MDH2456818.1 N-acetylglucosamine-6-phosphate deacetylase [Corynebacterium bovis]